MVLCRCPSHGSWAVVALLAASWGPAAAVVLLEPRERPIGTGHAPSRPPELAPGAVGLGGEAPWQGGSPRPTSPSPRAVACAGGPLVSIAVALVGLAARTERPVPKGGRHGEAATAKAAEPGLWETARAVQQAGDAAVATAAVAIDSAVAAAAVPLLPELAQGQQGARLLYFSRHCVALATTALVPLLLRSGMHRGRLVTAGGLVLLSASCLHLAVATSFAAVFAARAIGAMASALIIVPIFHTILLQAPTDRAGFRIDVTMCGAGIGSAFGPWVGKFLLHFMELPLVMVASSIAVASVCCAHLVVTGWIVGTPDGYHHGHLSEHGFNGSVFQAASTLLCDVKQRVLLAGVGLSFAVLSLHDTLVPAFLGQFRAAATGVNSAGAAMGLSVLASGLLVDVLAELGALHGMVVAQVVGILGLRAVINGLGSAQPFMWSIGLFASQGSIGAYLGLAMPSMLRSAASTKSASAVASAALGASWFLGDALGVCLQMALHLRIGHSYTIVVFAVGLAVHAMSLVVRPWLPRKAAPPALAVRRCLENESVRSD